MPGAGKHRHSDSFRAKRQEIESQCSCSRDPHCIPEFLTHGMQEPSHLTEIIEVSCGNAIRLTQRSPEYFAGSPQVGSATLGDPRGAVDSVIPVAYSPPKRHRIASRLPPANTLVPKRLVTVDPLVEHGLLDSSRLDLGSCRCGSLWARMPPSAVESAPPATTTCMDVQVFLREVGTNPRDRTL